MHEYIATAPFGLEGVVAQELRQLGFADVRAQEGGARFAADEEGVFYANLWLRCADRVLLEVGRFPATSFEELFEGVRALPWEAYLPQDAAFPVSGHCARSRLMSVSDCQAIAKKAIVERLRDKRRVRTLPETGETYAVQVALHRDMAALTLNTSGAGLSRRGYRTWNGEAPLRETLAAAMVRLSPWRPGEALHDPLCGTGTLLIEAAFVAARRAPGLAREFACEQWRWMPRARMRALREEARAAFMPENVRDISGGDIDADALKLAVRHLAQAGLAGRVPLRRQDVRTARLSSGGVVLTNPPYGQRLSDRVGCDEVARALRALQRESGRALCVLSGYGGFERAFGRRADRRRRLYNGRLECELMTFYPGPSGG